ncbi:hypothetical protein S83_018671, partial [Arachis hypogaea]
FLFLNPLQGSNLSSASEVGTPICIPSRDFIDIGRIASIENNHTPVDYAKKGLKGAIKNVEVFMDAFRAVIEERIKNKCHVFAVHTKCSMVCLFVVVKNICVSVDKFFVMIKDLDISRKKADLEGHTTRADGLRKPLMDIILDQLAYNIDTIPLFLKTFSEPKWKLEIVVHYLWKYMTKPSVHTRKSNGSPEDATFEVALKCFSNKTGTKSTIKKIGPDVMQFLVGH